MVLVHTWMVWVWWSRTMRTLFSCRWFLWHCKSTETWVKQSMCTTQLTTCFDLRFTPSLLQDWPIGRSKLFHSDLSDLPVVLICHRMLKKKPDKMLNPVTGCVLGILRKVVQQLFASLHWAPGEGLRGEPPQEIWPVDLVKSHVQKNGLLDFAGCCFISIKHALSWRWFLSGHRLSAVVGTHVAMTPVKWLGRDQVGSTQQNWIVCILNYFCYTPSASGILLTCIQDIQEQPPPSAGIFSDEALNSWISGEYNLLHLTSGW